MNILKCAILSIFLSLKKIANLFHGMWRNDFMQVTDAPREDNQADFLPPVTLGKDKVDGI